MKECELARKEWQGTRYQAATFTTIEATTEFLSGSYDKPWGASFASGVNKILGPVIPLDGELSLLGDDRALSPLVKGVNSPSKMSLIVQPGKP